jgi:DNA polymerase-3 subunit gamma/tau
MNYIVTARKWRPQTFEDVVGQEHITTTLKNAILNNRVAHSYLFAGPRGVGKTTTARILAKVLNCTNSKGGEPCNQCEMCLSFANSQSLDIIEIDGASNRRIEEIRTLRESVKYAPTRGNYKVYIIDEVHMLTTESFNALLKTLEEPPEHTVFIFATTDVHKVPLTIISRCQRFDFRRIEMNVMKKLLKEIADAEDITIDDLALTLIAKKADGALRDAQSLFDQVISFGGKNVDSLVLSKMLNLIDEDIYFTISDSILEKNFAAAFDISQKIYENGWNYIDFMNELIGHFRNIMTVVIRKNTDLIETAEIFKKRYLEYTHKFSEGDLLRIMTFLNKIQWELKSSSSQKLKIEISLCHLIGLEKSSTITEILSKMDKGEPETKTNKVFDSSSSYSSNKKVDTTKSNIRLAKKEEVIIPEIKAFVAPTLDSSNDFNDIISKWNDFIEQVKSEKLFFASVLSNSNPIEFINDQLHLEVGHPEDGDIIEDNKSYLDKKTKEVLIVSKIIRVALKDDFQSEIKWEGLFRDFNLLPGYDQGYIGSHEKDALARTGLSFIDDFVNIPPTTRPTPGAKVYPSKNIVFGQIGTDESYEILFKFLQTIGEARVLSSPRITVVNNQEAKIHVGERQAYITSTTTKGSTGSDTIAESVTFVDVGIELSVTPTINDDGFITMKIKPQISSVKEKLLTASGNQIPIIDTSEAETTVMVKDKTSIVIAGLRKDEFTTLDERVPYLSNVPVFGSLFRSGSKKKERTEVIILLTPHITGGEKFVTGELSGPGPTDNLNDYRGYSSLALDKEIRSGNSPGPITKLIKKLPFTSHD